MTLYRILPGSVAAVGDLRSHMAQCDPRRGAELVDHCLWAGVSTFDAADKAARRARRFAIGTFLAVLEIPDDDGRIVARPTLSTGHYTVWGCERLLLTFVRGVVPVAP